MGAEGARCISKLSGLRIIAGQNSEYDLLMRARTGEISPKGWVPLSLRPYFCICITNNPEIATHVDHAELLRDESALAVILKARDMVHQGWKLAANPLYGNFKPNQQPYRSIVLKKDKSASHNFLDLESLDLIEEAERIYSFSSILRYPSSMPDNIDSDFMYLDFVLMRETYEEYGILKSIMTRNAESSKA